MMLPVHLIKQGLLLATISVALFLQGCSGNKTVVENNPTPATPAEDTSFVTFFQKFSSDSVFQSKHLAAPVKVFVADLDLDTDPPGMEMEVKPTDWGFKDLTLDYIQNEEPRFAIQIQRPEANRADFRMSNEQLGAEMRYKFRLKDGRWELFEFRDDSDRLGVMNEARMEDIEEGE